MSDSVDLLIFGASARAAAFSALRAGLRPWCADLFADADLRAVCPCHRVRRSRYPGALARAASDAPPGPWMYTGGLENHSSLVRRLTRARPLWGNDADVLARVRGPEAFARFARDAGFPCPAFRLHAADVPPHGRWLVKPCRGSGGAGIHAWDGEGTGAGRRR